METIEIALAANQEYFCGLFVTACSIAASASKDVALNFNILDGGICERDHLYLEERVRHFHPSSTFNWLLVNEEMFAQYPKWNGNRMAYARLILPSALPNVGWIVYCDVDFLWLRDIAKLWREREDGLALIGTPDGTSVTRDIDGPWFAKWGEKFDQATYFCSGLCFMDLRVFREKNLIAKCEEVMARPGITFPDQAALNIATQGMTKMLRRDVWQRFTLELTEAEVLRGVVIHYAGEIPWKPLGRHGILSGTFYLWHEMNAKFRGITTWQSLRMFYSPWQIVWSRSLYYFWRFPGVLPLLKVVCRALHKSSSVHFMKAARARRFVAPSVEVASKC